MSTVVLSDGSRQVVLENVPEQRPRVPAGMDPVPDVTGTLVIYERVGSLVEIPMNGRLKTKAEALLLQAFADEGAALRLTERDGTESLEWRVKTDPAPEIRRKDGDSADYLCDFRLWRMP